MFLVLGSAAQAFRGLFAPGMGMLFFGCVLATLALLATLGGGMGWLGSLLLAHYHYDSAWAGFLLGTAGTVILVTFLFPLLMPIVAAFFDEQVAGVLERHAYPALSIGQPQPFWQDFRVDVAFTLRALLLNALCLVLVVAGPLYLVAYYLLNSYLLGTQFFMMAGGRHVGRPAARALARKHRMEVLTAGMLITVAAQVPFLNLAAPFWGVAMMVHLYQRISPPPQVIPPQGL